MTLEEANGPSLPCCWLPEPPVAQGLLGYLRQETLNSWNQSGGLYLIIATAFTSASTGTRLFRIPGFTLNFDGGRGGGRSVVIYSHTGVDSCILGQQVTDLQQDVPSVPAETHKIKKKRIQGEEN